MMNRPVAVPLCALVLLGLLTPAPGAAESTLSVEGAWKQLPSYRVGQDRACVLTLEAHVARTANDPKHRQESADRLASLLSAADTTDDARLFICTQLARVGGDREVPVLAGLLHRGDRRGVQMACAALTGIATEKAQAALRAALKTARTEVAPDLIQAVGRMRDAEAVDLLAARVKDPATAGAALWALGEIGTERAADALFKAGETPPVLDARLRCAERLVQGAKKEYAQRLYESLLARSNPVRYRVAALSGLVETEHIGAGTRVVSFLTSDDPRLAGTAATLLPRALANADAGEMRTRIGILPPKARARAIRILARDGCKEILPLVTEALHSDDPGLVLAAAEAVGSLGSAAHVRALSELAASAGGDVAAAAGESLAALDDKGVDEAIAKGLAEWPDALRAVLVRVAARRQIRGLSATLLSLAETSPALRREVYRALATVGTPDACGALVRHLSDEMDAGTRKELETAVAALAQDDTRFLAHVWDEAPAPAQIRESILRILASMGGANGLRLVRNATASSDKDLRREAVRALASWPDASAVEALLELAKSEDEFGSTMAVRGLMRLVDKTTDPQRRSSILDTLAGLPNNPAANDWARKKRASMLKEDVSAAALTYDAARSSARKRELSEAAPPGYRLVAYLDCGPDVSDGAESKPSLSVKSGVPFFWSGAHRHADLRAATVAYSAARVRIEASGLSPNKSYRIGLTWWDYDHNARVQTVSLAGKQVLMPTKLPSFQAKQAAPAAIAIDVPASAYASGTMPIDVALAGGVNVVVSEIWLYESDRTPEKDAAPVRPKRAANAKRILLITGEDYKGHVWQETAPVLRDALEEDPRLAVDLVEDLTFLRSPKLAEYAAVVMHFKNYDPNVPGRAGYDNLASFVENGGGLFLVHFACGAFQEFKDDFVKLAGRVWNPKLRGHDPFGAFTVNIVKPDHPAMAGLGNFETTDELYTCLDGTTPIEVLATAVSKVDEKTYPMIFVLTYGKGRVFHCPLGHNTAALCNEPVAKLFRRGTAWVAGMDVSVKK